MQPVYRWFYGALPLKQLSTDGEVVLLTTSESQRLKRLQRWAVCLSAIIGALGVVLLYLPKYIWPNWFYILPLNIFKKSYPFPLGFTVYSFVLVFIELEVLALLNIYCVHQIAVATGFLQFENRSHGPIQQTLMEVSLEKKNKDIMRYGINPLEGLNHRAVLLWNLLLKLKASLSNIAFKFLVQRMLGRYAFQWVQDMAGIPVFAAWNAWGTYQVLQQGRIIIMGQNLVETTCQQIFAHIGAIEQHESLIFNTLQFVAISKRDFHANHATLAKNVIEHYNLVKPAGQFNEKEFYEAFEQAPTQVKQLCRLLIVLGFLLDGRISTRERKKFRAMQNLGLVHESTESLDGYMRKFLDGKGIADLMAQYLPKAQISINV